MNEEPWNPPMLWKPGERGLARGLGIDWRSDEELAAAARWDAAYEARRLSRLGELERRRRDRLAGAAWAAELRSRRLAAGLLQRELGAAVGTSQAVVSEWETGSYVPSPDVRDRVDAALAPFEREAA